MSLITRDFPRVVAAATGKGKENLLARVCVGVGSSSKKKEEARINFRVW